jgi:hypothetical protein
VSRQRVFVPLDVARLGGLLESASPAGADPVVVAAGDAVHAVTAGLRADFPDADEEELEYLAMTAAAQASVAGVPGEGPFRRLVLALDAALAGAGAAGPAAAEEDPTRVQVAEERRLGHVVAAHLDGPGATDDVRRAVEEGRRRAGEADAEGDGAAGVLERCLDHELGWYAASELRDVPVAARDVPEGDRAGTDRAR